MNGLPRLTLVLGGARSGKSRQAEALARATGLRRIYIATAQAFDDEMRERIAVHRADRAADGWTTVETPLDLAGAVTRESAIDTVILVDCLTLWLSNVMLAEQDVGQAERELLAALGATPGPVVIVSNEVGLGIVPETPLGRRFRDAQGRLNQRVAALADHVIFVAAGLPLMLKPQGR
jgi:adenosylcobinamide kinase / adenosylcobinamide-phosphate guanylyltransferase